MAAARSLPGGKLSSLTSLRLGGAYRLYDKGLVAVLAVMPELQSLALPDAPRLTSSLPPHLPLLCPRLRCGAALCPGCF